MADEEFDRARAEIRVVCARRRARARLSFISR